MENTMDEKETNSQMAMVVAQLVDIKEIQSGFVRNLATAEVIRLRYPTVGGVDFSEVFAEAESILDKWYAS